MSLLPSQNESSQSSSYGDGAPAHQMTSSVSTQLGDEREKPKGALSDTSDLDRKGKANYTDVGKGYEDKGIHEIDDEGGRKKQVRLVLEQRTGKELIKEMSGGPYTAPRWRHSLPFVKPKYGPPPAPLSLDDAPVTPEASASFFSILFFSWISPLMALGSSRTLEDTDLWKMDDARSAGKLSDALSSNFAARVQKAAEYNARLADYSNPLPYPQRLLYPMLPGREKREKEFRTKKGLKTPKLAWALSDTVGFYFWTAGLLKIFGDTVQACTPLLVKALIKWSTNWDLAKTTGSAYPNIGRGVGLAIGLLVMLVTASLCVNHFFVRSMGAGVLLRSAIISSVYKRSLRLSQRARGELPNGKLINHISTDTSRIDFASGFFHITWTAPIQFVVISIILLVQIGYSALPGIGFLVLSLPSQTYIMKKLFGFRKKSMLWTDKRAKLIQELLNGMRIVKFMAWEKPFLERLGVIRGRELRYVRQLLSFRSGMMAFALSLPVLAAILSFVTYSLTAHSLQAATIFSVITLFNLMRMPLMIWPMSLSASVDAWNAIGRLQAVYEAEIVNEGRIIDPKLEDGVRVEHASFTWDAAPSSEDPTDKKKGKNGKPAKGSSTPKKPVKSGGKDVTLAQQAHADISGSPSKLAEAGKAGPMGGGERADAPGLNEKTPQEGEATQRIFQIRDIDLSIPRGSLTAIVGPIGSGKSSFLQGLMGEMRKTAGKITFSGSTALCAQTPWIQNATIRENILFGQPWDEERYWAAVRDSCLEADLELLEEGDGTEIGEKGINLSGGQKQRVNIARAVYFNADIIALDDPLSALDAGVGKALFFNAIIGALQNKTRIMVTHALHFLPHVDNIILMEEGRIAEQGTYEELRSRPDGAFARLVNDFGSEDKQDEELEKDGEAMEKAIPVQKVYKRSDMISRGTAVGLMSKEERNAGALKKGTYFTYLKSGNGVFMVPVILLCLIFTQGFTVMTSFWLVYWQERKWDMPNGAYMGIYAALGIGTAFAMFFNGFSNALLNYFASVRLHRDSITRVMFAPQSFFDTTPLGRIMNRFAKDIDTIDNTLPDAMRMAMMTLGNIIGAVILLAIIEPYFLIAMAVVSVLYAHNAAYYRRSSREFKRIDSILRSSLYSHFSESLSGIATIRSYGESERFVADNVERMNTENRAYYLTIINQRWLSIRLDALGSLLTFAVSIIVVTSHRVSAANGGLGLSTMITVQQAFSWMIRQLAEVENDMVGAERILHYANELEQEQPHLIEATQPPSSWPNEGRIVFDNVRMRYREELPDVLKGLTLSVGASEKIGVVGRTGAGKSSIMMALFRISELSGGSIKIDDVDVSKIGLNNLRSGISIIPQDPLLFSGTLRTNIDPFSTKTDAELYDALRRAHLITPEVRKSYEERPSSVDENSVARRFTLDTAIEEEGGNLSVGERSLVSLARAIVRDTKVLVLDEATASVDVETDSKIQETIRTEFKDKTLLCIAHRLKTILSYDRILVMSDGQVEEFDTPENLFRANGAFTEMCQKSSITLEEIKAATALRF